MKTSKILIAIITLLTLTYSCRKELEFNEKFIEPRLVVNSFITNDSILVVDVAASKPIPGVRTAQKWIKDATVVLFEDDVEKETLQYDEITIDSSLIEVYGEYYYNQIINEIHSSYYAISTPIVKGKTYRLKVSHPDYETVTSETTIPYPIEITDATVTETYVDEEGWGHNQTNYTIKFKDTPEVPNYYRIYWKSLTGTKSRDWSSSNENDSIIMIEQQDGIYYVRSNDPVLNPDDDANDILFGSPSNRYSLFTDERIDGKEYELSFYNDYYNMQNEAKGSQKEGEFIYVNFYLVSLTREAFLYMRSSREQGYYDGNPFSEPVQVFTNIENGSGIFAGYSISKYAYKKGEYPLDGIEYSNSEIAW